MHPAKPHKVERVLVECPTCGKPDKPVVHECPQWCDHCGAEYRVERKHGVLHVEATGRELKKIENTFVVLKHGSISLVVKGIKLKGTELGENDEYYYNEHICPVNYLQDVEEIYFEGEQDPHGVFQYHNTYENIDVAKDEARSISLL